MIVVDTSAVVAILAGEPEDDEFIRTIVDSSPAQLSAVSVLEAGVVMRSRLGPGGIDDLFDLLATLRIQVQPFTEEQARLAVHAYGRYGRGLNPRTRLNFGDCATYALAKSLDAPLLFNGTEFAATDLVAIA